MDFNKEKIVHLNQLKPTIYIDTTIFSYLVDTRKHIMIHIERTKEWWFNEKIFYHLVISDFVVEELKEGNYPNQLTALQSIKGIKILKQTNLIQEIVEVYLKNKLMPSKDIRDAIHLAYCSFYKVGYLLTWNCSHLANVNKKEHIKNINKKLGLFTPNIVTPLELRVEK